MSYVNQGEKILNSGDIDDFGSLLHNVGGKKGLEQL